MLWFWGGVAQILVGLTVSRFTWLAILASKNRWEDVYRQQRPLWMLMGLFAFVMLGRLLLLDAPLLAASQDGDVGAVRTLLACGADPNFNRDGTPLHYAVDSGSTEVVELLLDQGANPHRISDFSNGWFGRYTSPLELARHDSAMLARPDLIERMASMPVNPAR
jgi:hypothetical protein